MAKALRVVVEGREFECYTSPIGCGMISVSFYEVIHPTRKFFRAKWRDSSSFFIDNYDTIKQGVISRIKFYLADERKEQERTNKWKDFENSLK